MNKYLVAALIFGGAAVAAYFIWGTSATVPEEAGTDPTVAEEDMVEALKDDAEGVYGSCNAIASDSTCIDYIGSIWRDNNMAELNCEGSGTFSRDPCPYPDYGGCRMNAGTIMEMVMWAYKEGGQYPDDSIQYAIAACNAQPVGKWVTPEDML